MEVGSQILLSLALARLQYLGSFFFPSFKLCGNTVENTWKSFFLMQDVNKEVILSSKKGNLGLFYMNIIFIHLMLVKKKKKSKIRNLRH